MKTRKWAAAALSATLLLTALTGCGGSNDVLDPENPVTIEIWHYYNGDQQDVFDQMVEEFNATAGKEKGIVVKSAGQGSVADLESKVMASINGEVGASELPNIFAAYTSVAQAADAQGLVVDLNAYLTEEELAEYVDGYFAEGDFNGDGQYKIFPVAKSTEVLVLNQTDWDKFAADAGVTLEDLSTIEGVTGTAQRYYEWTDAQTPDVSGDGRAFFGRDAMANYMLIGSMQLGADIFTVTDGKMTLNLDEDVARQLWDNFYIPFVKGHFAAVSHFRSDDLKTGSILAYVGSSAGAPYYPNEISISDTESYPVDITVLPAPKFADGEDYAVQQGAGMVVTTGTEQEVYASVEFLKWFTAEEQNIAFASQASYLPVKKAANEQGAVLDSGLDMEENLKKALSAAITTVNENAMYVAPPFDGGTEARSALESGMSTQAQADRAVVAERLAAGVSLDEAAAEFCTDEHFQQWYEAIRATLEQWADS